MLLNCGVGEDSWESLRLQGDPTSPSWRRSALGVHWKDWCWSWNSSTLAISCEELTHWKRPWSWEVLGAGGEGDDRGWDGWMASLTKWTWIWVDSGSWWWTGRPGVLRFMGSQRVGHDWVTELNWHTFMVTLTWKISTITAEMVYLVAQTVENLPAMLETRVWTLGWEDPLGRVGIATHSRFLPGEFHEQRSLAGHSPWSCKESNTT